MGESKNAVIGLLLACSIPGWAVADDPQFIYPNKGQSAEQQEKDKYDCYEWGKGQTGFDPMKQPTATAPPPDQEAQQGGVVSGAAKGAVTGVAVGAIAGDAGKGAAIGAVAGGLFGGMRRRNQAKEEQYKDQQWADKQVANYQAQRDKYNRAYSACLEGRGYTVK